MATSRSSMPKEMVPLSSTPPKPKFGSANPFDKGNKPKVNPFAQPKKPKFAEGGSITVGSGKEATPGAIPPAGKPVKPTGGGQMRGGGAATRGKKFQGTF